MTEKVIRVLIRFGVIELEQTELYKYGFKLLLKKILHVAIILLIGFIGGKFWGIFFFLITYVKIREYAGGYHSKTELGCYSCTIIVSVCVLFILYFFQKLNKFWIYLLLFVFGTIIWFLSPQEAINKPLEMHEKSVYRKTTRIYVVFGCAISLCGFFCNMIVYGIVSAWLVQTVMLFAGLCDKK